MTKIRLYLDEDAMRRSLVRGLESRGVDVTTAAEEGMLARQDDEHLALATELGRAVCTCNASDFCRLHSEWLSRGDHHEGIIVLTRQQQRVGIQLRALLAIVSALSAEEIEDTLHFV